jgi:hydroxymethylpyrimidine pyrophosphatase-like HAD family hydrolase
MHILSKAREGRKAVQRLKEKYGDKITESWSNRYRFVDMAILRTIEYAEVIEIMKGFKGMKVMDSGFAYHIMDETVNKGIGVAKVLDLLGLGKGEAAGVGDSITDLELLRACGYSAIVANGDGRLRGTVDYIAREKFGMGFAEIAEKILSMGKA